MAGLSGSHDHCHDLGSRHVHSKIARPSEVDHDLYQLIALPMVDLDSADQRPGYCRRVRSQFISCQRSGFRRSMVALESLRVLLVIAAC